MLVVTPFHPGDADQALTLFRWIRDLGGAKGHSLILVADTRCSPETVAEIEQTASESFDSVKVLPFVDHFKKWPEAPNAAFAFVARHIMAGPREPWLLMEPDCAPLKPGWLDAIAAEYAGCGKPFMGARVQVDEVPLHLSGNAVYPADMMRYAGIALMHNEIAWDVAAAGQIVPQAHWTKRIVHNWKHPAFNDQTEVDNLLQQHPEAVLFHADKSGSLIGFLRERRNGGVAKSVDAADLKSAGPKARDGSNPSTATFDLFLKSYPPDFSWLQYCLRAIAKFATGFRKVVLVIPKGEYAPVDHWLGVPHRTQVEIVEVEEAGEGYLFQMAVKINAHQYTDADYVLHLDSDCILTRPITPETFMRNGKPLWLMSPYDKIDVPWKAITEKFVGEPVDYEYMRRLPILVPRSLHVAAARFCEVKHGMRLTDYILSQPNREYSEFNALGALAWLRARDEFEWLDTHAETLPEPVALQFWSHQPVNAEVRAQIENILSGHGEQLPECKNVDPLPAQTNLSRPDADDGPRPTTTRDDGPMEIRDGESNPNIRQTKEGIWILAHDSHISKWVEEHGTLYHDRQTLPLVLPEIPVRGTVIDVGANIGDTTAPFLERVGPEGQVIAFEPNRDAWECLRRNCPDAWCFDTALGDGSTTGDLIVPENAGAAFLEEGSNRQTDTIDAIKLARCDFIKIDVEGFELRVLKGAEQTINRFHPKMLIEINKGALERQGINQHTIFCWLHDHGYDFNAVQDDVKHDSPQYDILCTYAGQGNQSVSETHAPLPLLCKPWQSHEESVEEIKKLAESLKKFVGTSAQTRIVRLELHRQGVIELPYRYKRRKKWRKKAKA